MLPSAAQLRAVFQRQTNKFRRLPPSESSRYHGTRTIRNVRNIRKRTDKGASLDFCFRQLTREPFANLQAILLNSIRRPHQLNGNHRPTGTTNFHRHRLPADATVIC